MEYLQWKIHGEFICDLARSWFWEEQRPYDKCEELLLSCLETDEISLDEKKQIVVEILEGRKKLVGVNAFELVDDNENVRPLSMKIKENEEKEILRKIKEDIQYKPILYVDKYASGKDMEEYENFVDPLDDFDEYDIKNTPERIIRWLYSTQNYWTEKFTVHEEQMEKATRLNRGSYLMNPYLILEIYHNTLSNINEEEKYDKLYHYWENQNSSSFEVIKRQNLYLAEKRKIKTDSNKNLQNEELCKIPEPDDFLSKYGLIDRRGLYYSCGFGGHAAKVFYLIEQHPEWFSLKEGEHYLMDGKETDIAQEHGWILVHNPYLSGEPYFSISPKHNATKAQIKTAFDYMVHFKRANMEGLDELLKSER